MRKLFWPVLGLLILASTPSAYAAARLGPPIEELRKNPERIRIVVGTVVEKPDAEKFLMTIDERLSGEAPDEVLLRTDKQTAAGLKAGDSFIVAWTYQRRNRGVIGGWETDPAGPSTVQVLGLGTTALFENSPELRLLFSSDATGDSVSPGTTALFENSPELRLLFSSDATGDSVSPGRQIDALLTQLQREDILSRGLVVTQLYLRPDLTEQMNTDQVDVMRTILQTESLNPQHLDFLLRSAIRLPQEKSSPWLAEEFRRVIIENGTRYDLSTFVPSLVRTAARGLRLSGTPADIGLLSILLYSNNPGVSKAALESMDHLDRQATVARAERAISRDWIHGETRRILGNYLRQTQG
jgi:hypothetical protein